MKTFFNEVKKLFNPVLLVLLMAFAFIFQYGFLAINLWPNYNVNPGIVDLYAELVQRFGPTLQRDRLPDLIGVYDDLVSAFGTELTKNELFVSNGITTYQQFIERRSNGNPNPTEAEQKLRAELVHYTFDIQPASDLLFKIQEMEIVLHTVDIGRTFATDDTIQNSEALLSQYDLETRAVLEEKFRSDTLSLLPLTAIETIWHDTHYLGIVCYIVTFALVLFMLISDRLRWIYPLALSTKTGRRLYRIQATACGCAGVLVGATFCTIYGAVLLLKGVTVFWDCPYNSLHADVWLDLSYGQFLLISALEIVFTSGIAGCLSYIIGRFAGNYIAGLALSIPTLAAFIGAVYLGGHNLFVIHEQFIHSLFFGPFRGPFRQAVYLPLAVFAFLGVTVLAVVLLMVRRDKKRDIL